RRRQRLGEYGRLVAQPGDPALDAPARFGPGEQSLHRGAQLRSRKVQGRARRRCCRELAAARADHAAACVALSRTMPSAATAAASACAIESSIVSGPVAAPATNTPARLVAAMPV